MHTDLSVILLIYFVISDQIPQTPKPPKGYCLDGWLAYDTDCYLFDVGEKRLSWPDAIFDCAKHSGGKLVSIHDKAQNKFISDNARTAWGVTSIWIGLTRDNDGKCCHTRCDG